MNRTVFVVQTKFITKHCNEYRAAHRGGGGGGEQLEHFALGPSLKEAPGGPTKGPLFKRSIYSNRAVRSNTIIEQSQYSSEEQCSKVIDKEIWLVRDRS